MLEDDLYAALLAAFSPTQLIHAHENGARPNGVYATLRVENARRGHVIEGPMNPAGERNLYRQGKGLLELQCFGEGSYDLLDAALLRLSTQACQAAAHAKNVSFGPTDRLDSVPALRNDSSWEPRAFASLPFAYTRSITEALSWIETVEGDITIHDRTTPYRVTIVE